MRHTEIHRDLLNSFWESDMIDNDLINATEEISCLYWKEKIYTLKRSMSTICIMSTTQYHQYVRYHTLTQLLVPSPYCVWNRHIMCLFNLIRCLSSLMNTHFVSMYSRNYFWLEKNDFLLPEKCLRQLPLALLKIWQSCKGFSKKDACVRNFLEAAQYIVVAV